MLIETLIVSSFQTNCYIVAAEASTDCAVIDPGDDAARILESLREKNLRCEKIFLTHGHIDHVGAAGEIAVRTGAAVYVHRAEKIVLRSLPVQAGLFGVPVPGRIPQKQYLEGGESIPAGGLEFTVLFTPGHSPGGICLLTGEAVFAGDTLFQESIGRTDLIGGSYEKLLDSIRTKLLTLPDDTVIYPGHGPPTTIGAERQFNPFLTA